MARSRRACPERSRRNPGDASWQMLLGAFRPQTTTEDKKFTNSDQSEAEWRDLLFFPLLRFFISNGFSATIH
jgi:hypothetical protein